MTRSRITGLLVLADVAAAGLAFPFAFGLRFPPSVPVPDIAPYVGLLPAVLLVWPLVFALQGLYRPARGRTLIDEGFGVLAGVLVAAVVVFGADAYYRLYHEARMPVEQRFQFSRVFIATFVSLDVLLTLAGRAVVRREVAERRRRGEHARRVLVIGAGNLGAAVAEAIKQNPQYGYQAAGFADDDPAKKGLFINGVPVLGTTDDVLGLVRQERIDELMVALPWAAHDKIIRLLEEAAHEGLNIKLIPDLMQYVAIRAGFEDLEGIPLLNLSDDPLTPLDRFVKRTFDIVATTCGLALLSPLFLYLAVLVRRSSPGPAFYAQERMGLDGRRFTMYKFRTMPVDAESQSGPVFASDDDPRATAIGQRLRRTSLDELPQLWNVLRGDMSLVGPRPERPSFVDRFKEQIPHYMQRHRMRSGMTGWAQVNGWRGNTSIRKRIEHDLYYMRNWSLRLDVKIICLTLLHELRKA